MISTYLLDGEESTEEPKEETSETATKEEEATEPTSETAQTKTCAC